MAEIRSSQEPRRQVILIILYIVSQSAGSLFPQGLRQHIELQGQHVGRLAAGNQSSIGRHIFPDKSFFYLFYKQGITIYICRLTQHRGGIDQ